MKFKLSFDGEMEKDNHNIHVLVNARDYYIALQDISQIIKNNEKFFDFNESAQVTFNEIKKIIKETQWPK